MAAWVEPIRISTRAQTGHLAKSMTGYVTMEIYRILYAWDTHTKHKKWTIFWGFSRLAMITRHRYTMRSRIIVNVECMRETNGPCRRPKAKRWRSMAANHECMLLAANWNRKFAKEMRHQIVFCFALAGSQYVIILRCHCNIALWSINACMCGCDRVWFFFNFPCVRRAYTVRRACVYGAHTMGARFLWSRKVNIYWST